MDSIDKNVVNFLYDVAVIGINNEGLSLIKPLLDAGRTVCMLGKSAAEIEKEASSAVKFYPHNVIFPAFKHGVIVLTLDNKQMICCKNVLIADSQDKLDFTAKCKNIYYDKSKLIAERTTNLKYRNIAIFGNGEQVIKEAEYFADIYRRVYICTSGFELKSTKPNIQIIYNVTDITAARNETFSDTVKITLDTGTELTCDSIYVVVDKPDYKYLKPMIELDEEGYIITDEFFRSKIVPTIFAVGQTTRTEGNLEEVIKKMRF